MTGFLTDLTQVTEAHVDRGFVEVWVVNILEGGAPYSYTFWSCEAAQAFRVQWCRHWWVREKLPMPMPEDDIEVVRYYLDAVDEKLMISHERVYRDGELPDLRDVL